MKDNFLEVINIINKTGTNDYVLLIGSWAEFLYEKCNVIKDFLSNIKTKDIDFLIENVNKPNKHINILREFKKNGYEIEMTSQGIYRIIKSDFEVEFLAIMKGGAYYYVEAPAFMLPNVQALTHINMLFENPCEVEYKGNSIRLPNPYNYVLHKMIINKRRKDKQEKDRIAIANLLIYLDTKEDEQQFILYFSLLSKKEKGMVKEYIANNNLEGYFPQIKILKG